MATIEYPGNITVAERRKAHPQGSVRFDLWVTMLSGWFLFGMYLDGWAHSHGYVDNTFFTPWHAVLYSGYLAVGAFLVISHFRNVSKGHTWMRALPIGYMPALAGILVFGFAGGFDMVWHETFGFEENAEALLSPSHLLLAFGGMLYVTGPLRAAWMRKDAQGWRDLLPVVLTLTYMISLFTFFTMYANLFNSPDDLIGRRPDRFWWIDSYGVNSALITSALTMGIILFAMRRWKLPTGSITVILTLNSLLMFWLQMRDEPEYRLLLLAAPVAGLVGDAILYFFRRDRPEVLRIFSFLVPFVYYLLFFILLNEVGEQLYRNGLWWKIHMWLGVPILAGVVGVFLSYLTVPPALPVE